MRLDELADEILSLQADDWFHVNRAGVDKKIKQQNFIPVTGVKRYDATGTDDYSANHTSPITAYNEGIVYIVTFQNENTAKVTLNLDGLGGRSIFIKDFSGNNVEMSPKELKPGTPYSLMYYGDYFLVINQPISEPIYRMKTTIASAEFLAGFATPGDIIPALGSDILTDPVGGFMKVNFLTTAYAKFDDTAQLVLIHDGSSDPLVRIYPSCYEAAENKIYKYAVVSGSNPEMKADASLQWKVLTGNPTLGDSTIELFTFFRIVRLA